MPEAYYYLALCHLSRHHYEKAYTNLTYILDNFPKYLKKTVYLFVGIAAKNMDKVDKGLVLVSKGIEKYPDYLDLYLYRAKLY